jgi:hypothetical protein
MNTFSPKKVLSLLHNGSLEELALYARKHEEKDDWLQSKAKASQRDKKNIDSFLTWFLFLKIHNDELGQTSLKRKAHKYLHKRYMITHQDLDEFEAKDKVNCEPSYKNVTDHRAREFLAFIKGLKKTDKGMEFLRMLKKASSLSDSDFDNTEPIFKHVFVTVSLQLEIAKSLNSEDSKVKQTAESVVSNFHMFK